MIVQGIFIDYGAYHVPFFSNQILLGNLGSIFIFLQLFPEEIRGFHPYPPYVCIHGLTYCLIFLDSYTSFVLGFAEALLGHTCPFFFFFSPPTGMHVVMS